MQNVGQCSNADDEHKSINFAVIKLCVGVLKERNKKLTEI